MTTEHSRWWRGHGTPPKDFTRWAEVIGNFVKHCQSRYGQNEVRQWYFEAWNEPNLEGFWNGTQQQFFEMYKAVVTAIKKIDPQLRVGGPSTSSFHPEEAVYQKLAQKKDISAKDYIGIESKGPWIEDVSRVLRKRESSPRFYRLASLPDELSDRLGRQPP